KDEQGQSMFGRRNQTLLEVEAPSEYLQKKIQSSSASSIPQQDRFKKEKDHFSGSFGTIF
ncbi:hypothetical protein ABTN16_19440, partial [Acinetobacter baumannii]